MIYFMFPSTNCSNMFSHSIEAFETMLCNSVVHTVLELLFLMYSRIVFGGKSSILSKLVMLRETTLQCYDEGNCCVDMQNFVKTASTFHTGISRKVKSFMFPHT